MSELLSTLREAFESDGYTVADVTRNRDRISVVVLEEGANADDLRAITNDVVPDDEVLGLNVATESVEGHDGINTVVTFRHRSS